MTNKIILITGGPLKERVVTKTFSLLLPQATCEITSLDTTGEGLHIISKEDCLKLMRDKIVKAKSEYPDASYYIFMRGRFDDINSKMEEAALVLIQDQEGHEGVSQAASFEVPDNVAEMVREGVSFSKAVEEIYKVKGVKDGSGFVGILTKGAVSKEAQYLQPTIIALATILAKN